MQKLSVVAAMTGFLTFLSLVILRYFSVETSLIIKWLFYTRADINFDATDEDKKYGACDDTDEKKENEKEFHAWMIWWMSR